MGWWVMLAPTSLFGHTTYVVVSGHSMEPMLHTGDLAIARAGEPYAVGDLVVFWAGEGTNHAFVIHRLIGGSAASGWKTQGDNRTEADDWTVPNEAIAGRYWFAVPAFGTAMGWGAGHPLLLGLICAVLAIPFYLPWHRRKVCPVLAAALDRSVREGRREGRELSDYAVLAMTAAAMFASIGAVTLTYASHRMGSVTGVASVAGLVITGGFTYALTMRLFDGAGVKEPSKSLYALSGRLRQIDEFPALDEAARPVTSALELRKIDEKFRLPILHRVDPLTRGHSFLLITDHDGAFMWNPHIEAFEAAVPSEAEAR